MATSSSTGRARTSTRSAARRMSTACCATCSRGGEGGETEINSSDDNPLFDVDGQCVQSGGNFYGGHMGQAMDSLKVALANVCDLMDRQLELVVDEKFNAGLTPNLIPFF